MKIALIAIGIAIIGALFVIQDFGSLTTSDPVQSQPTSQPPSQPTPAPEPEPEPKPLPIPASFVDPSKNPQSYVDRYNNEPSYKKWFNENYPEYNSIYHAVGLKEPISSPEPEPIPEPTSQPTQSQQVQSQNQCDSSYPSVCIPPYPPDLDCGEIGYSNFRVVPPDPHGFDRDRDGIGCEVGSTKSEPVQPTQEDTCDPSYPDVCIPPLILQTWIVERLDIQTLE